MRDVTFWPSTEQRSRLATVYQRRDGALVAGDNPDSMSGQKYHGGGGGIMATAETYAQFAMMLANGGELNGVRILSPRTVELMGSAFIPSTLPGRAAGEGYGLGVRVDHRFRGARHVALGGLVRLERRVRHALLGRPEGEPRRHRARADVEPHVLVGLRERRDAGVVD